MMLPHIDVSAAAGLIDSAEAPPLLVFLSDERVGAEVCAALLRRATERRLSWLALTSADDDPLRFVDRLAASLEAPGGFSETPDPVSFSALSARGVSCKAGGAAEERAVAALTLLLDRLHVEQLVRSLVLDGYGVISGASTDRLVGYLLQFLPETLRVALFSGEMPTLIGVPRLLVRQRAQLYICER